jgi:uracil-DNA glycosylase
MNAIDIKRMFVGLSRETIDIVVKKHQKELNVVIMELNRTLNDAAAKKPDCTPLALLTPRPELIFNAFRLTPIDQIRVVLLGQDPYIGKDEATGLSFSVQRDRKIPPSLKNIYACLLHYGLIREIPTHGDISSWAKQGVLMLSAALTTQLSVSNAHSSIWTIYTDAILREISSTVPQVIFILLGGFAQKKKSLIDSRRHIIMEYGHPSPLNSSNRTDNPKHFKYCNAFSRVNDLMISRGSPPVNWNPDADLHAEVAPGLEMPIDIAIDAEAIVPHVPPPKNAHVVQRVDVPLIGVTKNKAITIRSADETDPAPVTLDTLWIFTDGGASGNGKKDCKASWGFYVTDGCTVAVARGIVSEIDIAGKEYRTSNQRGELTAILEAITFTELNIVKFDFAYIAVVSDSDYSIKGIETWLPNWQANPTKHKMSEKMNLDLLVPCKDTVERLRRQCARVKFIHVNSHIKDEDVPRDTESEEWFKWKCNDIVDKLCNIALGRKV